MVGSGGQVAEEFFEPVAGGEDAPGDGGFGATEGAGGFGVVKAVVDGEDEGGAVFGVQFHEGFLDETGAGVGRRRGGGFQVLTVGGVGGLAAVAFVLPVEAKVDGDAIEPGGEAGVAAEAAELAVGLEEGVLREVGGIREGAGHAIGEGVYHALVAFDELRKRLMIAMLALANPPLLFVRVSHVASF